MTEFITYNLILLILHCINHCFFLEREGEFAQLAFRCSKCGTYEHKRRFCIQPMSQNTEIRPRGRGTAGGFFAQMLQEQLKKKKTQMLHIKKYFLIYYICTFY